MLPRRALAILLATPFLARPDSLPARLMDTGTSPGAVPPLGTPYHNSMKLAGPLIQLFLVSMTSHLPIPSAVDPRNGVTAS